MSAQQKPKGETMTQQRKSPRSRSRGLLLAGCALGVMLSAAARPDSALAQAALASPEVVSGNINIDRNTPDLDIISIDSITTPTGIIDWFGFESSAPGDYLFLPATGTMEFNSGSSGGDFTILNRIFAPNEGQRVEFLGQVRSLINGQTGGNVWFYSPDGIVVSGSAVFDVGSLILTTNEIDVSGGLTGQFGEIRFAGPFLSTSGVVIGPDAQINAPIDGAYVAIVAPHIENAGTITVNGSTALIAAEQVNLTVNNGLFDISVQAGTSAPIAINQTGTITGPAATSLTTPHRIYLSASANNAVIQTLVSGTLGYEPATVAGVENGAIVLAAGNNISGGVLTNPHGQNSSSLTIGDTEFTSRVDAASITTITVAPQTSLTATSDVTLTARDSARVTAGQDVTIDIAGNLTVRSRFQGTGGVAIVETTHDADAVSNSRIQVGGDLLIDARGLGTSFDQAGPGTGGTATLALNSGEIRVDGAVQITADGIAGNGGGTSGIGTGGQANLFANGGSLTLGDTEVSARGVGSNGGQNLAGFGGQVNVRLTEAFGIPNAVEETLTASIGDLTLDTGAFGGAGSENGYIQMFSQFVDPASKVNLAALDVSTAFGADNDPDFDAFNLTLDGGPLMVSGGMLVTTPGSVRINALTDIGGGGSVGRLRVLGNLSIEAETISIDQLPMGADPDTITADSINMIAQTSFSSTNNAVLAAATGLSIHAVGGHANVAGLKAAEISVIAGGDITLRSAEASGVPTTQAGGEGAPLTGLAVIRAGFDSELNRFDPASSVTITGAVNSTGATIIQAGEDVILTGTASVQSDNRVVLAAGDDILVATGALVRAANDPLADPANLAPDESNTPAALYLDAGGVPLFTGSPDQLNSIVVNGQISAPGRPIFLTAEAIQIDASPIVARALSAKVTMLPAIGGDDGGNLRADCLIGTICLGEIQASHFVRVGADPNQPGDPMPEIVRIGAITGAQRVGIRALDLVDLGTGSGPSLISGSDLVYIQSTEGNVNLRAGLTISGGTAPDLGPDGAGGRFGIDAAGAIMGPGNLSSGTNIGLSAGTTINVGALTATENIGLFANGITTGAVEAGGALVAGSGTALGANGVLSMSYDPADLDTLTPAAAGGAITINGDVDAGRVYLASQGAMSLGSVDTTTGAGTGAIDLFSDGVIQAMDLRAGGDLVVDGGGAVTAGIVSGRDVTIDASGALTLTSVRASDDIDLFAAGHADLGEVETGGLSDSEADGSNITIAAASIEIDSADAIDHFGADTAGVIAIGTLKADSASLTSSDGAITVSTDFAVATPAFVSGTSVALTSLGDLNLDIVEARTGDFTADAGLDLTVDNATARGDITLSGVNVDLGSISTLASIESSPAEPGAGPGAITVTAEGDITLHNVVSARDQLELSAGGLVNIKTLARGTDVMIASTDIEIGVFGALGLAGVTNTVTLSNNAGIAETYIGGEGEEGVYSLSNAELNRIASRDLVINGANDDVFVGAFSFTAGSAGPIAADGSFQISGKEAMRVVGDVEISGLGDAAEVTFTTIGDLLIDNQTGSIALLDGSGELGGTLFLSGQRIVAASAGATTDVLDATDLAERDAILAVNDGPVNEAGVLQARGMVFTGEEIYVQNTGGEDIDERRGLTFGAGGLAINTPADPPGQIVLNGRMSSSDGFITGADLIPEITVNGQTPVSGVMISGLNPASTLNSCLIVAFAGCGVEPEPEPEPERDPETANPGQVPDLINLVIGPLVGVGARPDAIETASELDEDLAPGAETGPGDGPPRPIILIRGVEAGREGPPIIEGRVGVGNFDLLPTQ